MIDPATMTDAAIAARLADAQRLAPELKAAAEHANRQLAENTTETKALTAEAEFRATMKELRRKSSAARVEVLRALSTAEKPIGVKGPVDWLIGRNLIGWRPASYTGRLYFITDLGRRALAALETA